MKKIININLSGRVIPIEDAAYESLQRYIESLRRYFAHEEGRDEIINDIESRIAELMDAQVKKGAPAVSEADMALIIDTMGRVEDFEEVEGETAGASTASGTASAAAEEESVFSRTTGYKPRGRLYRDSNDKILGGVCSGIANYFSIDPAIVRIILVLLVFGAGTGILLYLLLWIFLPKRPLANNTVAKRFFRNPDDRIIGGVAGGIAAYFNKDAWTIRLIWLAPLLLNIILAVLNALFDDHDRNFFPGAFVGSFTFTFFISYVVLWIILPEARSSFQKMEMRGEDVDVHRIKENVKIEIEQLKAKTQAFGEDVKEQARQFAGSAREFAGAGRTVAGDMTQATGSAARGCFHIIGVILKAALLLFLGFMAFMFFMGLVVLIFGGAGELANNFLLEDRGQKFLGWSGLLLLFGVPFVALITWAVRRLMRVRTHNRYLGWSFGALWLIGIVMAVLFAGSMFSSFRHLSKVPLDVPATSVQDRLIVRVNQPQIEYSNYYSFIDADRDGWDVNEDTMRLSDVRLRIDRSSDAQYHVTVWRYSRGDGGREALRRAEAFTYPASVVDSFLNLGSGFAIGREQKYRNQYVVVQIQVPVGKKIRIDASVNERLETELEVEGRRRWFAERDWDWANEAHAWQVNTDYVMTESGELVDPAKPVTSTKGDDYEYKSGRSDSLRRAIDQKREQLQRDQEQLERLQREDEDRGTRPATDSVDGAPAAQAGTLGAAVPSFDAFFLVI
ncbi:PspC domain-containing protein [Flaviaesturariibacter amylovorans]|uniref:PspC domain-containing protein n=1 Tax=Flaviaesturariibacter amylovorans TaxID=1084520 RepID=A0ABP8HFI4_9BACT